MKQKTYLAPATKVFKVEPYLLNTISNPTATNVEGLSVSNEVYEDEGRSRRGISVWDD